MQLCGDVATTAQSSGVSPFGSDPAQWSPCSSLPEYGDVVAVMDTWLNTGPCGGSWLFLDATIFLENSSFVPSYHISTKTHPQFATSFSFFGARPSCTNGCVCCAILLFLPLFCLRINVLSFLKDTLNNGGNSTQVTHGGELSEVEQPVVAVWLLLVPNTNPCPFR